MRNWNLGIALFALAGSVLASSAFANPISVGVGAFSSPTATIGFENIANNALITNQYASQDVVFSGGLYGDTAAVDVNEFTSLGGGNVVAGNFQNQVCTSSTCEPITASFANEILSVGFYIISQQGTTTVQVFSGNSSNATGSFTFSTNDVAPTFFGVQDTAGIDRIVVTDNAPPGGFAMDQFMTVSAVPEASGLYLLGAFLLYGVLAHWRSIKTVV